MNITCQLTTCSRRVSTASPGEIDRGGFKNDKLRTGGQPSVWRGSARATQSGRRAPLGQATRFGLTALGRSDSQRRHHDSPASLRMSRRMATMSSGSHEIHRRVIATDIAVAEQAGPPPGVLVPVLVSVVTELCDIPQFEVNCITASIRPRRKYNTPGSSYQAIRPLDQTK
jgi:hypothetical protein